MRWLSLLLLPLIAVLACSNPAAPVESSAPVPSLSILPGTTVTPNGMTCAQVFQLAYGPYTGSNQYWSDYWRLHCTTPDTPVTSLPSPTPPPAPAPRPNPTCVYGRAGCTKTAGNN